MVPWMISIRENYEIGEMDTDIVRRYMEAHNPVNPQIEGRIKLDNTCTRTAKPANCNPSPSLEASTNTSVSQEAMAGNNPLPSVEASVSRSSKPELSFSILSLLLLLLEKFLP